VPLVDLTAQHATTASLEASETKFRRMAEQSKSVIFIYTLSPRAGFDYVSPAVEQISGYPPAAFYDDGGATIAKLAHPDSAAVLQDVRPLLDRWSVVRWRHRDGSDVWTEQHMTRIKDAAGRTVAWQGEARDVTEQHIAEQGLRRLAAVVETASDAIFTTDAGSRIQTWNGGAEALFGLRAEQVLGADAGALVLPDRAEERERIRAQLRAGDAESFQVQRTGPDGKELDISVATAPLFDASGRYAGASNIARDITGVTRRERELGQLAAAIDSSGDAIFVLGLDGAVLTWNRGAEVLFGATAADAIGVDLRAILSRDAALAHDLDAAMLAAAHGETVNLQGRCHCAEGHRVDMAMTMSPTRGDHGISSLSVVARTSPRSSRRSRPASSCRCSWPRRSACRASASSQAASRTTSTTCSR
jgi:PAS domain S-box-containing protein